VFAILRVTIGEALISLFSARGPVGLSEKIVRIGFEEGQWEVLTDNCDSTAISGGEDVVLAVRETPPPLVFRVTRIFRVACAVGITPKFTLEPTKIFFLVWV